MQDSPIDTPLAPVVQQPKNSRLARTSMVLGILSASRIFSLACLLFIDMFSVTIPDWLPWIKWLLAIILCLGFCLGLLAGLPAIVTGHVARNRTRRAPERYGGAGFAKTGIVMGYVSIFVTMIVVAIALPSLVPARTHAQKNACIANLRQIDGAKEQWALENKKTKGEPADDDQINAYLKNSARPVCPQGGVYSYNPLGMNPTCSLGAALGHTL